MIVRISCESCGRTKFAKPVRGEFAIGACECTKNEDSQTKPLADVARVTKAEAKPLLLSVD